MPKFRENVELTKQYFTSDVQYVLDITSLAMMYHIFKLQDVHIVDKQMVGEPLVYYFYITK